MNTKKDTGVVSELEWNGVIFDYKLKKVNANHKLQKIRESKVIQSMMYDHKIECKPLEKLVGKLEYICTVFPAGRSYLFFLHKVKNNLIKHSKKSVDILGEDRSLRISEECVLSPTEFVDAISSEFEFWLDSEIDASVDMWLYDAPSILAKISSDAANNAWCARFDSQYFSGTFDAKELNLSIYEKEAIAADNAIKIYLNNLRDHKNLSGGTLTMDIDNTGLVDSWRKKRSRVLRTNEIFKSWLSLEAHHNINLNLVKNFSENQLADYGSRNPIYNFDHRVISEYGCELVESIIFGPPDVDAFSGDNFIAPFTNKENLKFYAADQDEAHSENCIGLDFFTETHDKMDKNKVFWMHGPEKDTMKIMKLAIEHNLPAAIN